MSNAIQKVAENILLARANSGNTPGRLTGSLLWSIAGKGPEQLYKERYFYTRDRNSVMDEFRTSLENPQTPLSFPAEWLLDIFNGGRTDSGIRVSEMTALQADAVLACVSIISKSIASLPVHVFERQIKDKREAKRKATDHPLYNMIRLEPNPEMTSRTMFGVMLVHDLLWGNAYVEIQRDNGARPIALWPRNPARTRPVRLTHTARIQGTVYPPGTLVYHTSETMGDEIAAEDDSMNRMAPERIILAEDMIHVPGLSLDGRLGQSTVYLSRQAIGLALSTEKYGAKFFGNGAVPRGILELPGVLEPKALENLKRSWQEAHGGENQHKTAVLEQGVKYTAIGLDAEKSQFLATRNYQRKAIASIFQVPPHMIGEGESSKSTTEQTSIEFLNNCLSPWIEAYEQEFKRKLLPLDKKAALPFFVQFDTHRLLYGTAEARSKYYQVGKNGGWLNTNDIREMENLNPVEDGSGDIFWMPVNMQDAANPLTAPHIGGAQNQDFGVKPENPMGGAPQNPVKPGDKGAEPAPKTKPVKASLVTRYERIYFQMFKDATRRVQHRKEVDESQFRRCFTPALYAMVECLSSEFASSEDVAIPASEFNDEIVAYMEGMRMNLQGVDADLNGTYAMNEVRRAAETFADIVDRRYNPNHAQQPRHPDGKFHDGKKPFFTGRHGTTDDDVDLVWSGWRPIDINAQGEAEVAATIEKIKGLGIVRIVSSELPRAMTTARRYATALGIPMTTDWRLNALNLKMFEGLKEKDNADRLEIYIKNPDVPIPGGDSITGYLKRTTEAMDELRESNESTGPILALTHSSTISSYVDRIRGKSEDLENASDVLSPAGVLRFDGKKITVIAGKFDHGDAA